ncbi:hypothetical protein ACFPK9_06180 [Rubritalea spongiae]|uniref:DUF2569 family protein n=1 Tax=Rubritalea spongiae TaxID=430797 RepID=A0ABW5E3R1_9BACT
MSQKGMSAYQPEREEVQPPELPLNRSKIPKVLGIIHLCFGGLAILSTGIGVFQNKKMSDELAVQFTAISGEGISIPAELIEKLRVIDFPVQMAGYIDLAISVLLIAAGIGLLKYFKWGRVATNVYAVGSLLAKCLSVYIWCVLATPFFEGFIEANSDFGIIGVSGFRGVMLASLFFSSVYPLVCLFLVNKKTVQRSLE